MSLTLVERYSMVLDGVNKKCQQCSGECKQYAQVVVCYCPNFKSIKIAKQETE